ncbi:MAG: hypothetical protein RL745_742, partial [Actinomycetota bacterium]
PPAFRGAGVGIAIAVKLTPVVFLGYFVWCKQWRSVALAAAAAICCSGLAELVIPRSNADYWHWLSTNAESIGRFDFVSNQSFRGLAARIWGSSPQAVLAWVLCCLAVAVVATVALSRLARADFLDRLQAFTVIAIAGLLVAPIAWSHHWTIIIVVGAFAVVSPDSRTRIASWALWLVAFGGVFWFAGGSPVGFLRGWPADVLVSNALVLAGFAWLCACALGVKHRHCAPRLPRGDGQYQAAEQHSEHHRTGPAR